LAQELTILVGGQDVPTALGIASKHEARSGYQNAVYKFEWPYFAGKWFNQF
jgi:hypothetical protein